ncbi:MAG: bifunctional phosphopantothenoylcysteine decarboxylase/phosphopantothenate--cysteine ligase CoaBC [Candidatus Zixiibacteriota bacterium]
MSLNGYKIAVGITGGIAAYKIPSLIRLLKKGGAEVHPIMTESATRFITELTIETVSQIPVAREMFPDDRYAGTHHITAADWPDLFIIAPATANFIGKIASGICDDLLTTVICATNKPVIISPAMNSNMYLNPITQKNIQFLKSVGYIFIDPESGELACETSGPGRMPEPEDLYKFIEKYLKSHKDSGKPNQSKKKALKDKKVVVTAGPCREPIDPVRFISNRSSGKMGYALAESALRAGAEVTLISGPSNLIATDHIIRIDVETTEEMFRAVEKYFKGADILIMAAAPADFKIKNVSDSKIKKKKIVSSLELSPTIDILKSLKEFKKKNQIMVGFALETENGLKNASAKLKEKGLDLIILNSMEDTQPFDNDTNKISILDKTGEVESIAMMDKSDLADIIIDKIGNLKK